MRTIVKGRVWQICKGVRIGKFTHARRLFFHKKVWAIWKFRIVFNKDFK